MLTITEKIHLLLQKVKVDLNSKHYQSLRHKKLYVLRNQRLMMRMVRRKYPTLLAQELSNVQVIEGINAQIFVRD